MVISQPDPTSAVRGLIEDHFRQISPALEDGLKQAGINADDDTSGSIMLKVALSFVLGEPGGRGRAIGLLRELSVEIGADRFEAR